MYSVQKSVTAAAAAGAAAAPTVGTTTTPAVGAATTAAGPFETYGEAVAAARARGGFVAYAFDGRTFSLGRQCFDVTGGGLARAPIAKTTASAISALAGRHPYNPAKTKIPDLARCFPLLCRKLEEAAGQATPLPSVKELAAAAMQTADVAATAAATTAHLGDVVLSPAVLDESRAALAAAAARALEHVDAPPEVKAQAVERVSSTLQRNRGTRMEASTIDQLKERGHAVEDVQASFSRVFKAGQHYLAVVGQADAVVAKDGKPAVCEIKNRVNGFRPPARCGYDVDQLACYVFLSGYDNGVLVEQYNGKLKERWYSRAELAPRWEAVLEACGAVIDKLRALEAMDLGASGSSAEFAALAEDLGLVYSA